MSAIETTTIRNTFYGPQGQPYALGVTAASGALTLAFYWTEVEAWDARDAALDAGVYAARVLGAPTRGYAIVPRLRSGLRIAD